MGAAKSKDCKVVMLGLDNAGKTTLLNTLSQGANYEVAPTRGFNVQSFKKNDLTMQVHDIGGQASTWRLWPNFLTGAEVVIFVIDSADLASGSVDARTVDGHVIGVFFHE